jgi:hypothetical protein
MRWLNMRLYCAVVLPFVITSALRAEEKPDTKQIDALIVCMDSDDLDTREAAFYKLAALGVPAREALERAVKGSDSLEVRTRATQLLNVCAPGGAVVNGMRLGLTADRTSITSTGEITFTVTVCNISVKPVAFYEGRISRGGRAPGNVKDDTANVFQFIVLDSEGVTLPAYKPSHPRGQFGSAAGPRVRYSRIESFSMEKYSKVLRCAGCMSQKVEPAAETVPEDVFVALGISSDVAALKFDKPGEYRVRACYKNDEPRIRLGSSAMNALKMNDLSAWTGELQSNEITITIPAPAETPRKPAE